MPKDNLKSRLKDFISENYDKEMIDIQDSPVELDLYLEELHANNNVGDSFEAGVEFGKARLIRELRDDVLWSGEKCT